MFVKLGELTLEAVTLGATFLPKIEPGPGWYPGNRPVVFWSLSPFNLYLR